MTRAGTRVAPLAPAAPYCAPDALAGRHALVTGGTRGIGRAIALALAGAGARVTAIYARSEPDAATTRAALAAHGTAHAVRACDVADARAVAALVKALGPAGVDVLVNNAAIARDGHLMMLTDDAWHAVLATDLTGPFLCTRAVLRGMIARGFGRIVNLISPAGLMGKAGAANYAAAKGGLLSMTKSLAAEVARFGVTVNAVCPGVIDTPLIAGLAPHVRDEMVARIPAGRMGTPGEVAAAVVFLALPQAAYVTGATLTVDGGLVTA